MPFNLRHDLPQIRAFTCSYAWSLSATWQRWWLHHSVCHSRKPHAACKPDGSICYRTGVRDDRSLNCGRHFGRFLLLWPWPWPYDLHIWTWPVLPGDIWLCKYELSMLLLSKVIVWQTNGQTDIQRESTEIRNQAASRVVNKAYNFCRCPKRWYSICYADLILKGVSEEVCCYIMFVRLNRWRMLVNSEIQIWGTT